VSYDDVLVVLVALSAVNAPEQVVLPSIGTDNADQDLIESFSKDDPDKGKIARNIIRDYYCYQFGVKNIELNPSVVTAMCAPL